MRALGVLALVAAACVSARKASDGEDAGSGVRPTVRVVLEAQGGRAFGVTAEVAANDADRARGLMFRRELKPDEGMLFVFPHPDERTFWMKNTLIPLDMIYADENGTVLGVVERAEPLTQTSRSVPGPSRFVLEVIGGWCADRGVGAGAKMRIDGLDRITVR